jgi:hypothetical protein
MIKHQTRIGAVSELLASAFLLKQGYEVFRNVAPDGCADIVAFNKERLRKIDVKTTRLNNEGKIQLIPKAQDVGKQNGVEILYVLSEKEIYFAEDIDDNYNNTNQKKCPNCLNDFIAKSRKNRFCKKICADIYFRNKYKTELE